MQVAVDEDGAVTCHGDQLSEIGRDRRFSFLWQRRYNANDLDLSGHTRNVDRNLDVAQRLRKPREWMINNVAGEPRFVGFRGCRKQRARLCRRANIWQDAKTLHAEFVLDLTRGPQDVVEQLARKGGAEAETEAAYQAAHQGQNRPRRTFAIRLGRGADQAGLANREALILRGALQLLQEVVVEIAIGVGGAFEIAELDFRLAGVTRLGDQLFHVLIERCLSTF